eukprot:TRINITY_DN526_c0_g1_i1.p1 TRINITY_DN526_c0_g1~~TRINITY_DN526_c0_g1_i1.p1  ORF type:complete len:371 (+),score=102.19 TRINITY_DN526_c0_g1_i1:72-1115(+)
MLLRAGGRAAEGCLAARRSAALGSGAQAAAARPYRHAPAGLLRPPAPLLRPLRRCSSAAALRVNMQEWLRENLPTLKPPVANKLVYGNDSGCLKVMAVGGPNERSDFHIQEGEEFFLQLKGRAWLHIVEGTTYRRVDIPEGHAFLLPPRVWHSPQRAAESAGIVIERGHPASENDGLRWHQGEVVPGQPAGETYYEEYFHCEDLGKSFGPIFQRWQSHLKAGGAPRVEPNPPIAQDAQARVGDVIRLSDWLARDAAQPGEHVLCSGAEVRCVVHRGPLPAAEVGSPRTPTWLYVLGGEAALGEAGGGEEALREGQSVLLGPRQSPAQLSRPPGSVVLVLQNSNATFS